MNQFKIAFAVSTLALGGCANALYFGTYTRVGIDASTDGAGIGAKNEALNIAPPKKDGSAFDVLGTSDLDISLSKVVISEVVAVGEAARCAASKKKDAKISTLVTHGTEAKKVGNVIFGTYSSWSLVDLSWGNATAKGINFGYKSGTGVRMPVVDDDVGSVYAKITVNSTGEVGNDIAKTSQVGGTRATHSFATGTAAIIKASAEANALNNTKDAAEKDKYPGCL